MSNQAYSEASDKTICQVVQKCANSYHSNLNCWKVLKLI